MSDPFAAAVDWQGMERSEHNTEETMSEPERQHEHRTHPSVGCCLSLLLSTLPANAAGAATSSSKAKKKGKKGKAGINTDDSPALVLADVELTSPSGAAAPSQSMRPPSPPSALGGVSNSDYAISVMPSPPAASAASSNRSRLGMHAESKEGDAGAYPVQTPLPAHAAAAIAASEHFERHIDFNDAIAQSAASAADAAASVGIAAASVQTQTFPSNLVRTSKYSAFDFIPRNLFEQFNEPANLYFLFVGILQAIPAISTTAGIPTHYLPLLFIVAVSATRAAVEDWNRHVADEIEGRKKYLVYDGLRRSFVTKSSADIVVGDIVQMVAGSGPQTDEPGGSPVSQNGGDSYANYPASASASAAVSGRDPSVTYSASFPADMLFLSSSHEKGHCFVETASLDGETSLKLKQSLPISHHLLHVPAEDGSISGGPSGLQTARLRLLDLTLDIEAPNSKFDSFKGVAHINPNNNVSNVPNQKVALKPENLLLRGTELRNTPAIFGLVVYTGIDSKIRRNVQGASSRSKKSALMTRVNYLLVIIAFLQLSLCFFAAVLCFSWTERNYTDAWYLRFTDGAGLAAFSSFFTWFIILAQLVPISLLVSNELVKAAQAKFIAWDLHMFDAATNQPCVVRNSQLHENLGQVEYIFSDKTGTLTQNKMEFRVGFVGSVPFGSPDSEIARRVAQRMEQLRREQQASPQPGNVPGAAPASSSSGSSAVSQVQMEAAIPWTTRVAKLIADQKAGKRSMPAFNDDEKARMLLALWGPKQSAGASSAASSSSSSSSSSSAVGPADKQLAAEIRMYLTHMAISNTITPELKKAAANRSSASASSAGARKSGSPVVVSDGDLEDEYVLNFSSPDELALCQFASAMGFQFQSRSKDGVQLCIDKQGYGDGKKEIEIYSQLATLDFTSTRKRVTCVYQRENQVFVMCKGADANVLPLIASRTPEAKQLRDTLDMQLSDMATKGLRTLVVAGSTLPSEWWFGSGSSGDEGLSAIYRATNLPDRGAEKGHNRGECRSDCRICAGLLAIERAADLTLLGATAIEDRLQDLVPEAIDDFLKAGIKVWMLTGDKRETAKNIAMACMLIDPDMEASSDLLGSLAVDDMNRVIEITGDWLTMCNSNDQLRQMFDILDCGGDVVDGYRTGYISKEELRLFLVGLRVPGMDDDRTFAAHWHLVESVNGRIAFAEFSKFIRNLQPSHLKAVQTDIELGLRKARLIAGDGTEEEKRERLEKTPISLVVEGEAFSVFYPDTKVRKELAEPVESTSRVGRIFGGGSGGANSAADRQRAIARRQQEEDEAAFSEPEALLLRETFFELASMAKSVICCRLTPAQKGKIVQEFSKRHVTLAIGDGGNDELMIKRASVGVGIAGLEGTAASRASEYSIGSFRFLHTLLFVHGYWCSRRISKLTLFIFYKAALVAFSMYLFGFYSSFSGQQFFNDAIYILFNVCFTALPIIMLAIFDRGGLSASSLENDPRAYLSIANGHFFHDGLFAAWILKAFWNAIFIFGVVYLSIGIGDTSGPEGRAHGLWLTSTVVYTIVVLLVTCRILFECESINVFVWFFVIASFAGYFPVVYFANTLQRINPNLFGVFEVIMANPLIWALMGFGVAVPLLVDVSSRSWKSLTKPTYVTVMQERQRLSVADRLRMDQEAAALNSVASNHRVRTRTAPHLSQQQKDGQLIAKIRKALEQANHESARQAAASSSSSDSASASDNSQKRAEALVYTMTRFQNLSGSNFDATPQRNILQLYEVQNSLTPQQLEAIRAREAEIAAETQKQHSVQLLKQQQAEKQREEERQRRAEEDQQREWQRQSAEHHRDQSAAAAGKKKRSGHCASDVGSANELVLNLAAPGGDHGDSDSDIVEHEDSEAVVGGGHGRVHLTHQLGQDPEDDEIELSTHDLGDSHDPEHFVFQPRSQ